MHINMLLAEPTGEQSPADVHLFVRRREICSLNQWKRNGFRSRLSRASRQPACPWKWAGKCLRKAQGFSGGFRFALHKVVSRGAANCMRLKVPGGE